MSPRPLRSARVRVPASTSNLGSGFDTVGLALDRYLDAFFEPDDSGSLIVERRGTLVRLDDFPGPDLVGTTLRAHLESVGAAASGRLVLDSNIPVVRGLGSSGAALLAGCDLARAALGVDPDPDFCFLAAYEHEGHGDNAAPSVYGGLRAVVPDDGRPRVIRLELSPEVGFAYAAPAAPLSTKSARAVLPPSVPHGTAVSALGHLVALLQGLAACDPELIRIGIEDELHVPFRLPLIAGGANAVEAGYQAGAWGVTISGGGSGLIAVCPPELADAVAQAMRAELRVTDDEPECVGFAVRPDLEGMRRLSPQG